MGFLLGRGEAGRGEEHERTLRRPRLRMKLADEQQAV